MSAIHLTNPTPIMRSPTGCVSHNPHKRPIFITHTRQLVDYIEKQPILPFRLSKISKNCLSMLTTAIHRSFTHLPSYETRDINDTMVEFMSTFEKTAESRVMPESIRNKIRTSQKIGRMVTTHIHNRTIQLYLILPKPIHNSTTARHKYSRLFSSTKLADCFFDTCARRIIAWLDVALRFAGKECASTLDCYLFLTDDVKKLPKNTIEKKSYHKVKREASAEGVREMYAVAEEDVSSKANIAPPHIEIEHANTAFTYSCTVTSKIVLFRMEEWFKVFIHETFHSFGLDFSQMNMDESNKHMSKLFPKCHPDMDFRIYETYCETWAETIHVVFIAYLEEFTTFMPQRGLTRKDKSSTRYGRSSHTRRKTASSTVTVHINASIMNHILKRIEYLIQRERMFSLFQMVKVLHHQAITYTDLCRTLENVKNAYTEKTQVFAYYIVKPVLLFHLNEFIEWCYTHNKPTLLFFNKTQDNIREYGDLIERLYLLPTFTKIIEAETDTYSRNRINKRTLSRSRSQSRFNIADKSPIYDTLRMSLFDMETT